MPTARSRHDPSGGDATSSPSKGLGGARIDRIAERAGVNKRLHLLLLRGQGRAVPRRARADLRRHPRAPSASCTCETSTAATAMRRLVEFTWHYYLDAPRVPHAAQQREPAPRRHLKRSTRVREMNSPLDRDARATMLERGAQRRRVPRRHRPGAALHLDRRPRLLLPLEQRTRCRRIFGRDLMPPKAKAERLSHMTDVVMGYVLRD